MRAPALALLVALPSLGCLTVRDYIQERKVDTAGIPPLRIDQKASELTMMSAESILEVNYEGPKMRKEVAEALDLTLRTRPDGTPARFRVRASVRKEKSYFMWVPCFFFLVFLGCPTGAQAATVDLDLEYGGKRFTAQADESVWLSPYYNGDGVRAALARATAQAVARIAENARRQQGGR